MSPTRKAWRFATIVALALLFGPLVRSAAAVTVPGNFTTIQAAINAVVSGALPDGTTIDVQPGTYPEALLVANTGRSFTVRGVGGAGVTVVDAAGRGAAALNVFRATGRIVFAGVTFRRGAPPVAAGGGFVIQEASPAFLDCIFESNTAIDGAGGALITSNATFAGCIIRNNTAARLGGGVLILRGSRPLFTRCDVVNNHSGTGGPGIGNAGVGGGVHSSDSSPTFRGSRIDGNTSAFAGGGIYHAGSFDSVYGTAMLLVEDSEVADNVSNRYSPADPPSEGGGIHVEDNVVANLIRARILRNLANTGGGLNAYRARYDVFDSVVDSNQAAGGIGGGINASSTNVGTARPPSVVNLTSTLVRNNFGTTGGGIVVTGDGGPATLTLLNSVVDSNQSSSPAGAASSQGGGILLNRANLTSTNSLIVRNIVRGGVAPFGGGILVSMSSSATINGTTIASNSADVYGGGVFIDGNSSINMSSSRVYRNIAGQNGGGGIFVGASGTNSGIVQNSTIADNTNYQITEHPCPRTTLTYQNNTITPRPNNNDFYFSGCQGAGATTSINAFNALSNTSGNNSNPPQFAAFIAVPSIGNPSTLAWSVARVSSVTINASTFNVDTGTVDVAPAGSTTFTLTASGVSPVTARVTVATGWGAAWVGDVPAPGDYDGDGKADIGVYRTSTGEWLIRRSSNNTLFQTTWGAPSFGDVPVPGDYDGDGKADVAVYRTSTGEWFIRRSSNISLLQVNWGAPSLGDVPVPADYDGDGKTDIAVYRSATGEWFIQRSQAGPLVVNWGAPSLADVPVPADYDGDGKADIGVYRATSGQWILLRSQAGAVVVNWGAPSFGDVPVPKDYDGDGRADVAVVRLLTGEWFINRTTEGFLLANWGAGDARVPADYDGDGKSDVATWRGNSGTWLIR